MALREVIVDTETTGLDPGQGHRLVEIACVELIDRVPSGRNIHCYINPERDVPAEASDKAKEIQNPHNVASSVSPSEIADT
jgi:DNA polymerase III epsilon subunit-like protein